MTGADTTPAIAIVAVASGLSLAQIAVHAGIAGGFSMTSPVPIVLGVIVLSLFVRLMRATVRLGVPSGPAVVRGLDPYVGFGVVSLLYVASTHIADQSFGWWLCGALLLQGVWFFVLYAVRNAAGSSDGLTMRLQDWTVLAALSGIATAVIWSLHVATPLKMQLLAACFCAALFFDEYFGRNDDGLPPVPT